MVLAGFSVFGLHFDSHIFPEPHEFRSGRRLSGQTSGKTRSRWFAIGATSRPCAAQVLVTWELNFSVERILSSEALNK